MSKYKIIYVLTVLILSAGTYCNAQIDSAYINRVKDTVDIYFEKNWKTLKPEENKIKFSFSLYPSYSQMNKLGVTVGVKGKYRNSTELSAPKSTISLFGGISTNKSGEIGIAGTDIGRREILTIDYIVSYSSLNRSFWGIGYETNSIDSNKSKFLSEISIIYGFFKFRLKDNLYLGPFIGYDYYQGKNFTKPELIASQEKYSKTIKGGIHFSWFNCDDLFYPTKGTKLIVEQSLFLKGYYNTTVTFNAYHPIWENAILAYDLHGNINYGDCPWTIMPKLGGDIRMRSYYKGRYRDNKYVSVQVELRQDFLNFSRAVLWIGAGNVFPTFKNFRIRHTLPDIGIGYRFHFEENIIRLDFGIGRHGTTIMLGLMEAF